MQGISENSEDLSGNKGQLCPFTDSFTQLFMCRLGKWGFLPSRSSIVFSSLETVLSANSARVSA